jgi:hypothetical protein
MAHYIVDTGGRSSLVQSKKILQRNNITLSLVILTWLRQLQQFFLDKNIRMGTGTFLENIAVQPKTFWRILHHFQTSTSPFSKYSTQNNLSQITQVKHFKPFEEKKVVCTSLKEWALCILQPNKSFNWKYFMLMILKQHSIRIEWQERNAPLLKSQRRILLYLTLTVTPGTTTSRDWILRQTDMKDNQTRN